MCNEIIYQHSTHPASAQFMAYPYTTNSADQKTEETDSEGLLIVTTNSYSINIILSN